MRKTGASLWIIGATICTVAVLFVLPITPRVAVSTALVERGELLRTVTADALIGFADEQPIAALSAGQVRALYAQPGQAVQAGELLASLNAEAEQTALARLAALAHQQDEALASLPAGSEGLAAVASAQNDTQLALQAEELRASIAAKQLRARTEGVVAQVYASAGDYVAAGTPLLLVRGEALELTASLRAQDSALLQTGAQAAVWLNGRLIGTATLTAFDAPAVMGGQLQQGARFALNGESPSLRAQQKPSPAASGSVPYTSHTDMNILAQDSGTDADRTSSITPPSPEAISALSVSGEASALLRQKIGSTVQLDILWDVQADTALLPVSAIDGSGRCWVVREGRAHGVAVDASLRNGQWVAAPGELVGERVVLLPDRLYEGCAVKEARP